MNLEYALITSASLPTQVKESANYEDLVNEDSNQQVLLLICARGTPEQEEADKLQREHLKEMEDETHRKLQEADELKKSREEEVATRDKRRVELRKKSKSIFNALYGK